MSTSMVNSKGTLFIALFLFVSLSFQVLAHDEENNVNHLSNSGDDDGRGDGVKKTVCGNLYSAKTIPRTQYAKKIVGDGSPIDDEEDDGEKNSHQFLVSQKNLPSTRYEYNSQSTRDNPSKLSLIGGNPIHEDDPRKGNSHNLLLSQKHIPSTGYKNNIQSYNPSKLSYIGGGPEEEEDDGPGDVLTQNILPSSGYEYNSQLFTLNPSKLSRNSVDSPPGDDDPRDQKTQLSQRSPSKFRPRGGRKP